MIPSPLQQVRDLAHALHAYRANSPEATHRAAMARRAERAIVSPRSAVQATVREILHSTPERHYTSADMQAALAERGITATRTRANNLMKRLADRGETTRSEKDGAVCYQGRGAQ